MAKQSNAVWANLNVSSAKSKALVDKCKKTALAAKAAKQELEAHVAQAAGVPDYQVSVSFIRGWDAPRYGIDRTATPKAAKAERRPDAAPALKV